MATNYSLICFGGRAGKTATMTIASPCVVTLTNHGLRNGTGVVFTTSGALPTGVTSGTTYYARWTAANTFNLYDTSAHAIAGGATGRVVTTGTQSGTHTIKSDYWVNTLDSTAKLRYGSVGSERAYDSLSAWVTARSSASPTDIEICEVGMAWDDINTSVINLTTPAAQTVVWSKVDGVRSAAFHNGVIGTNEPNTGLATCGYALMLDNYYATLLDLVGTRCTVDGITLFSNREAVTLCNAATTGLYNTAKNNVLWMGAIKSGDTSTGRNGFYLRGNTWTIYNNIVLGITTGCTGMQFDDYYGNGGIFANNLTTKCTTGMKAQYNVSGTGGWFYNNISVGNTTNWSTYNSGGYHGAAYNFGASGDTPWYKTTDTGIKTMTTSDFVDHTNNDFTPKAGQTVTMTIATPAVFTLTSHGFANGTRVSLSTSGALPTGLTAATMYYTYSTGANTFNLSDTAAHAIAGTNLIATSGSQSGTHKIISAQQVDVGTTVVGTDDVDILEDERPNYDNGATETWDGGPFEFDHGYTRPQTRNLVIPTLVSGSQVQIFTTGTTTALTGSTESSGTSLTQDMAADMTVDVTVMKAGYHPIRVAGIVLDSTTYTLTVDQEIDRTYVASSGLTYTTNATIDRASKEVAINVNSTLQNFRSFCIEQWIDKGANGEALANLDFPFSVNGPNSVTFENGWVWEDWGGGGTGSASIARLSRDGMRYLNTSGNVVKAWCAVYTPDTAAGLQVRMEQVNGGSIVSASNTGPMDQLVQIISDPNGDGSYTDGYNYTGHMQLRVQSVGYTKPLADVYATFGTLEDQLYSIGLAPALLYTTTNADPGGMTFNNGAKTAVLSASRSVLQLYQGAQWWTNQDAQWDADVPLTANTSGTTFTLATGWTLSGMSYITGTQTIAGGTVTLAGPATYTPAFSDNTLTLQGEGTYVFTATGTTLTFAPTANAVTYVLGTGTFSGTIDLRNTHASRTITVELPSGVTYTTANNTGAAITVSTPQVYQSVTVSGATAGSRIQVYDTTSSTELYNGTPTFPYTWTDSVPAAATRAIRLRVAYQSTVTAKTFIEANIGTCAVSGSGKDVSYLVSQTADTTYDTNAIDGASIYATSGITFTDASPDRVNCNIAGGAVTYATIYACFVYWSFTSTGIANDFTYIAAPDTANYLLSGMKIRNTSATDLTVTGGWGRDATSQLSKDIIDTAGSTGNIFLAPDHVIPYSTGSGLTAGQASELTTAASVAAQFAFSGSYVKADIRSVKGIAVGGSGTANDPWGP